MHKVAAPWRACLTVCQEADTPGCTAQACSIRDAMPDPESFGIEAVDGLALPRDLTMARTRAWTHPRAHPFPI
jgi:hypothetical protein